MVCWRHTAVHDGHANASVAEAARRHSKEIDAYLRAEEKRLSREVKVRR